MFSTEVYWILTCALIFSKSHQVVGRGSTWRAWTPRELMEEATENFERGDYKSAIYDLEMAIKTEQYRAVYYEMLGKCYSQLNDSYNAIENFQHALSITPKDEDLRVGICDALFNSERYREAVENALELNDKYILKLAKDLFAKEEFEKAILCYDELIKRRPRSTKYHVQRGDCYMAVENFESAVDDFEKASSLTPKSENIKTKLSRAQFHSGRFSEIAISKLIDIGNELYDKEDFNGALKCFDELTRKKPGIAEVFWKRGLCHRRIGDLQWAIMDFEEMIRLPGHQLHYRIDFAEMLLDETLQSHDQIKNVIENLSEKNLWDKDYARVQVIYQKMQENKQKTEEINSEK